MPPGQPGTPPAQPPVPPNGPSPGWQGQSPNQPPQGGPPQGVALQAPWMPPVTPAEDLPGIRHGVPLARRGRIALDAAGFTDLSGDSSILALVLDVHLPVANRTFVDVRLPMANVFPGNIMLGASRVSKLDPRGFLSYGAQIGLPLLTSDRGFDFQDFSLPNGTWNIHEYTADFLPIKLAAGYERLMGQSFTLRFDLEPVLSIPIGERGYNAGFALQHAAELQYGHSIGAGLRIQGVAITPDLLDDAYQLAIEPFFVVKRELGFARLGLMMPIDESAAGPAFERAWGLRLAAGLHID